MRETPMALWKQLRRHLSKGQAIVAIVLAIAALFVLPVGLLVFEVSRCQLAQQQLSAACDSAALGAAATLASQDNTDPQAAHEAATTTALFLFRQNQVCGISLNAATQAHVPDDTPALNASSLFIEFIDPLTGLAVDIWDARGKTVRITGAFGLQPAFGRFLGIPSVPIRATASGGVPMLDVVTCFDVSGSIDDQTPVTFVKRYWTGSATAGKTLYAIASTRAGSPAGGRANGNIYDIVGPPPTGTRVNGVPPQYLSSSNQGDVRYPINFSEEGSARGLRGSSNAGAPPGNFPPGTASTGNAYTYTDLVVNIDGKATFGGMTTDTGYSFPDIATLVEAARGNLEDGVVFSRSKADTGVPSSVAPRAGYQAAYQTAAAQALQPIGASQDAVSNFLSVMNNNTDAHFGFVAFSDNAGTSPTGTYSEHNIDSSYPAGGRGNFPIPNVLLSKAAGATNYNVIQSVIPQTVATTSTNIGDAVHQAVEQLQSNSRPGAKKAIVLFTDGQPTAGGPLSGDPWANARAAAVEARQAGIPIYTIGLAQNEEIIPSETALLNDTDPDPATGGMAAIAGNQGKFFLVTRASDLRATFEHIARLLVQLVQ